MTEIYAGGSTFPIHAVGDQAVESRPTTMDFQ